MVLDQSPELDRVFHALAHPARRAILRRLTDKEQNLSELASPLRMSFPAASKHVRVLEKARLVRRRVDGRSHMCRLHAAPLKHAADWTEGFRKHWEVTFQRLDALLIEMGAPPPSHDSAAAQPPSGPRRPRTTKPRAGSRSRADVAARPNRRRS